MVIKVNGKGINIKPDLDKLRDFNSTDILNSIAILDLNAANENEILFYLKANDFEVNQQTFYSSPFIYNLTIEFEQKQ
jgi:hypothetical protein